MKNFSYANPVGVVNTTAFAVADLVKEAKSTDATFNLFGKKIEEKAQTQSVAIKKDRVYSGLDTIDSERDTLWRDSVDLVSMCRRNPVKSIKEAAETLFPTFDKYGKQITKTSYDDETAYLESAKSDLDTTEAKDAISAILGLGELLEELWKKNEEFKAKTAEFVSATASSAKSATVIKKEIVSLLNSLIAYIDAVSAVRDDLKEVGSQIELRISRANV